jgi:hypothetical protein
VKRCVACLLVVSSLVDASFHLIGTEKSNVAVVDSDGSKGSFKCRLTAMHDSNSGPRRLISLKGALGTITTRSMADCIFDSMHSFVVGDAPPTHNFEMIFD